MLLGVLNPDTLQLKKEGTYGKYGEMSTPSKNVNNSSRKSGKAQEK